MGPKNRYAVRAHFCLYGESLVIAEISRKLGRSPTKSHEQGQPTGRGDSSVWEQGFWSLSSTEAVPEHEPLQRHLEWLLDRLSSANLAIGELLESGLEGRLYIGFTLLDGQGGPTLETHMLRRLADLGVRVEFEIHW